MNRANQIAIIILDVKSKVEDAENLSDEIYHSAIAGVIAAAIVNIYDILTAKSPKRSGR